MYRFATLSFVALVAACSAAGAQQASGQTGHSSSHHQDGDSAFAALQSRGKRVMGVDQYTSTHRFESLPDGGRIVLQRDSTDAAGTSAIRAHLRDVARRLTAGDFTLSTQVHAKVIPGASVLRARRQLVRYEFRPLPRGGEVRVRTMDSVAVAAVHEFLAFQKKEHR